jgi:hypothetical protein
VLNAFGTFSPRSTDCLAAVSRPQAAMK